MNKFINMLMILAIFSCDSKDLQPSNISRQLPNKDGIEIALATTLVPNLVENLVDNIPELSEASKIALTQGKGELDLALECEDVNDAETRCAVELDSSELEIKAKDFFFGLVGGVGFLRRGCKELPCEEATTKVFWRSIRKQNPDGKKELSFEVCNIEGAEFGLGFSGPLSSITSKLGKYVKGIQLNGLKIKAESYDEDFLKYNVYGVPVTDAEGNQITGSRTAYKTTSVHVGLGALGGFPNSNCDLSSGSIVSDRDPDDFKSNDRTEQQGGEVAPFTYSRISGGAVKFAADITGYLSNDAGALELGIFCKKFSRQDSCKISYDGPSLTIPIPKYITGIIDAKIEINRSCKNFGCKQAKPFEATLTTYKNGPLKVLEVCELSGLEVGNLKSFPFQDKLFGLPDIKGLKIAVEPNARDDRGPLLRGFRLGISKFGDYPTNRCGL